ncbi:MAG: group II truncated hemoglobin, partial [Phenylobacterium sp.]
SAPTAPVAMPFDLLGGESGVRRLVDAFYDLMETDPDAEGVRGLHGADLTVSRDRLADWLSGWLGGPQVFPQRHPGRPCLMSVHHAFDIGPLETSQWLSCMRRALESSEAPAPLQRAMLLAFGRMSQGMRRR